MCAGPRERHKEQAFFFMGVRTLGGFLYRQILRALDHTSWRWTALAAIGRGEARYGQPGHVNSFKFEALAAVDCHQSNSIKMKRRRRDLPQIPLFGEQHQLANTIQPTLDRKSTTGWALLTHEIQKLPDSNCAHSFGHTCRLGHTAS